MNNKQKEVEKQLLEDEKQILEQLKENYSKALSDVKERIKSLTIDEMTQSKIYQKQYQENLEKQLRAIIDLLSTDNVQNINDYLIKTYQDGFIGTLYNMQSEGVPFVMPINQETVLKSISKKTEDFQLSKTLYKNADELKKTLKSEITRGISQGYSYNEISKKITLNSEADLKKSYRIARTEGGRVQTEAKFECMKRAKANGADVVKEWDSTMDKRTRESHVMLDGQIRELEEPFEVFGNKAMYPHDFNIASEDINCRCIVLERARWAVEDNNSFTKNIDGDIVEFQNVKDYKDYKEKYFDFYKKDDKIEINNFSKTIGKEHIEKIKQTINNAPENIRKVWNNFIDEVNINDINYKGTACYSWKEDGIYIDLDKISKDRIDEFVGKTDKEIYKKAYGTLYHETGHHISAIYSRNKGQNKDVSEWFESKKYFKEQFAKDGSKVKVGQTLDEMIRKEGWKYIDTTLKEMRTQAKQNGLKVNSVNATKVYQKITKDLREMSVLEQMDISDMFDGITNGKIYGYGQHSVSTKNYWRTNSVGSEAFAEMFDATINNPNSLKRIKEYFPKSYEIFEEIIKEMGNL